MAVETNTVLDPNSYRVSNDAGLFTQNAKKSTDLGRNEFMTLLVKQLENQDPMEPMKDEQFVAQLATFSSLEQLTNLNTAMTSLISGQNQMVNSQSLNLIGRQVLADTGGSITLGPKGADTVVAEFASTPAYATVKVLNPSGGVVRTINIDHPSSGRVTVQWDGKDDKGNDVAQGDYKFTVSGSDGGGKDITSYGYLQMVVDGIHVGATGIQLVSGNRTVDFGNVIEIRTPDTTTTTTPDTSSERSSATGAGPR